MFFFTRNRKNTNMTCDQQLLQIMEDWNWHSTDSLVDKGIIDYRTAKYLAKLKGYIFDRRTEPHAKVCWMNKKGTRFKTFYKLVGRVPECHKKREKRDYLRKFSNEEIISELWARNMLSGKLMDDKIVHFLNQ